MDSRLQRYIIATLLLAIVGELPSTSGQTFYAHEKSLRTDVLTNYEYKIRPNTTVTCNVRLSLLNINILDVPSQSFSVSGWLTVKWTDERLTWTPASYGEIEDFYDTESVLWRPELIVDNSVSNLGVISSDKLLIRVQSGGEMTWEPPGIFETHCDVDVTFYPFDTQTCQIEVTSWAYTLTEVEIYATDSDIYLLDFQPSGEWEVLSSWSERRLLIDGSESHSQVEFFLQLRRRPSYYVMTILIPVIVTSLLCVLVFILPADSGEKVGYILTVLLTYVVMLSLVASYMPPTSKTTSVLSIYLSIILFVGVFSTLITVVGLYFHHHPDTPIPNPLSTIFCNVLIPFVHWKKKDNQNADESQDGSRGNKKAGNTDSTQNLKRNEGGKDAVFMVRSAKSASKKVYPEPKPDYEEDTQYGVNGKSMKKNADVDDDTDSDELSWQDLALILDAFAFRTMGIFVLVLTFAVMVTLLAGGYA